MDLTSLPPDYFTTSSQFTKKVNSDVYPSIDPTSPALSQAGKVVIITGASKGLGRQVSGGPYPFFPHSVRVPDVIAPPSPSWPYDPRHNIVIPHTSILSLPVNL